MVLSQRPTGNHTAQCPVDDRSWHVCKRTCERLLGRHKHTHRVSLVDSITCARGRAPTDTSAVYRVAGRSLVVDPTDKPLYGISFVDWQFITNAVDWPPSTTAAIPRMGRRDVPEPLPPRPASGVRFGLPERMGVLQQNAGGNNGAADVRLSQSYEPVVRISRELVQSNGLLREL